MKKLIALLLAVLLLPLGALAEIALPLVTEPVTLTYWVPLNPSAAQFIQSYNENEAYREIERRTGVHIEFIHPATNEAQQQFNLMMLSGELPDIIAGAGLYNGGEFQGMTDGWFLNLTEYLPEYAPDYWKLITSDDEAYREATNDAGDVAAFYLIKPQGDPPFRRIVLRQDMLDELGAQIPETLDELEALFDKMLAAGITPYMLAASGYEEQLEGLYQVLHGFYKDLDGKVQFGQIQPQYKDYLALLNKWYQKGYISPDFTSVNITTIRTMFDTKQIGTFMDAIVANYNRAEQQGFKVVSAPYPRLDKEQKLHYYNTDLWPVTTTGTESTVAVSASSKHKELAIKWLNYGYTQEGSDLYNWGVEGVNYDVVDGKKVYNDTMLHNPKFGTEEASYIYKIHFGPKHCLPDTVCHANLLKSEGALASRTQWADADYIDSAFILPPFKLNPDQLAERTAIMSDVNTYVNEMVLKFITGAESLDGFDSFVSTVKGMGIDRAVEITAQAYEAYLNKPGAGK